MHNQAGYNCILCGMWHTYTMYVHAHRFQHLTHRCHCGAAHDIYDGEATLHELSEPQITEWLTEPPIHEGFYHIRFPNGTEADRNWYWSHRTHTFLYDKDSPVSIAFGSIGAWRGVDHEHK